MSFDALLKLIPDYLDQLLRLVSGPRRFFKALALEEKAAFNQAFLFLFNSSFLAFVFRVPFAGEEKGYWREAIITAIAYIPAALIFGLLAFAACRLLGGKGSLRGHVAIFCYLAGVSVLLFALTSLFSKGVVLVNLSAEEFEAYKTYMALFFSDQTAFEQAVKAGQFETLEKSRVLYLSMGILAIGLLVIAGWMMTAWRAFGDWNALPGLRTAASFVLFAVVGYGASKGLVLAQAVLGIRFF